MLSLVIKLDRQNFISNDKFTDHPKNQPLKQIWADNLYKHAFGISKLHNHEN